MPDKADMQRNSSIDVLKGILAIFVIVLHFPIETAVQCKILFPYWINMTVPAFMLLSGYVFAVSFQKRQITSFEQAYSPRFLAEKLIRFIIPYSVAFAAEWIVFRIFKVYLVSMRTYGIFALFLDYLSGGKGQGSYYFPVMIQFIFLFPLIYFVIKKYDSFGLTLCFAANAVYEILKVAYRMNDSEYRLLVFRYLFVIAAGCYLAVGNRPKNEAKQNLGALILGAFFIYLFSYTGYAPKVITYWTSTSFLACLFIVPVLGWLLRHVHWSFKPLEIIGRASFNIFLIQMIYDLPVKSQSIRIINN